MRFLSAVVFVVLCSHRMAALEIQSATLHIQVRADGVPADEAQVVVAGVTHKTDAAGSATVAIAPGLVEITVIKEGFLPATTSLTVTAGTVAVLVDLQPLPAIEEEVTVVATTRTGRRLDDQPMRVEVLDREEIEEKMLMTPGDIVMMLNEMGGMRVQATSPSLGAATVRIQGMRGRYTRVLSDGLPLFGEVGGLGLLQIPPMDLGQVEVVKGVASALYGAGAMGGVVNLLSRRPGGEAQQEFLVNRSTRGATDAVAFLSGPLPRGWSASLLGGGHWQQITDVDEDVWADLAGYARGVVRPRLFWDGGGGKHFFATAGATYEDRDGGTIDDRPLPQTGEPYVEALETERFDAGAVGQWRVGGRYVMSARAAIVHQRHDHRFGEILERDRHDTASAEVSIRGSASRQIWVAGVAVERDAYEPMDVPRFAYTFTVPGAFVQYDVELASAVSLSSSGRVDFHSEYGTFFSPRVSALFRARGWTSRLSLGSGFFASTALTEETEAAGLSRLELERPLEAERGFSGSFDVARSDGPLAYSATLFASRVADPLHVERSPSYVLRNLTEQTTNVGLELLGTLRHDPFALTATYTYVQARETVDGIRGDVVLTPRHSAGVVGMWEEEDVARVGVEWYYTGAQRLEENPYRTESERYMIVGVLAERQFGALRLFVNGENLTGVRQTRWDPLLRPTRGADGRWTVDAWAPLDGRNINGGVRLRF